MPTNFQYFHAAQPIIDICSKEHLGYELLLRCKEGYTPLDVFKLARDKNCLVEIDLCSIDLILKNYSHFCKSKQLFLNIFLPTIMSPKFDRILKLIKNKQINNLVLEINESDEDYLLWQNNSFYTKINAIKSQGIHIAIDDFGQGQSTFENILKLKPDYIKVDKFFANDLSEKSNKQAIVKYLTEFSKETQAKLILEGIETEEGLEIARKLGVNFGQGYYIGKPEAI